MISLFKDFRYGARSFVPGHAAGDDDAAALQRFLIVIVYPAYQIIQSGIILSAHDHGIFIAAHAEDGALLEGVADQLAGAADIQISAPPMISLYFSAIFQILRYLYLKYSKEYTIIIYYTTYIRIFKDVFNIF